LAQGTPSILFAAPPADATLAGGPTLAYAAPSATATAAVVDASGALTMAQPIGTPMTVSTIGGSGINDTAVTIVMPPPVTGASLLSTPTVTSSPSILPMSTAAAAPVASALGGGSTTTSTVPGVDDDMSGMAGMEGASAGANAAPQGGHPGGHAGHDAAGHAGHAGMSGGKVMHMHGMSEHMRSAPENRARAQAIATAVTQAFGHLTYAQTNPGTDPSGTHRRIPPALVAKFKREHPGLPCPSSVVFNKPGGTVVGALYVGKNGNPPADLGMGGYHTHGGKSTTMSHIWFTPENLDLAFSDVMNAGHAKKVAASHR
jgi:hypothetical protein